jgi:hypothetical protein
MCDECTNNSVATPPRCPSCARPMKLSEDRHGSADCPKCIPLNAERVACRISARHDNDRYHNVGNARNRHERRLARAWSLVLTAIGGAKSHCRRVGFSRFLIISLKSSGVMPLSASTSRIDSRIMSGKIAPTTLTYRSGSRASFLSSAEKS